MTPPLNISDPGGCGTVAPGTGGPIVWWYCCGGGYWGNPDGGRDGVKVGRNVAVVPGIADNGVDAGVRGLGAGATG